MAALCPGVQYGLSSQISIENKELIFLKLTDSAVRAIEEYLKISNKSDFPNPKIRFVGKENGELSFPSQQNEVGQTTFNFSTSSTSDMEGPAGSFECICGTPPKGPLTSLGSIRKKIRIHANDDVYEATRNRMNEVEDKYKNKCTREIKPNQNDIGRKVKVKQPVSGSRHSLISSQQGRVSLPSMRDSLMKPTSYTNPSPVKPPQSNLQPSSAHSSANNVLSNGLGSNHVSSSQRSTVQQTNRKPSGPEVSRRPLRERLIQLLALRPFKKIELHDRLTKEGLRGSSSMTNVLKDIAILRDNCYYLNRNMWNEVNDDWPFYTETEKQILKRRKPQNLTPPGGSDGGSSGSGQSPTSTHPGSPPMISSSNGLAGGTKRPGYSEGADGFPYKKQRIAHGVKGPNSSSQPSLTDGSLNYSKRQMGEPRRMEVEHNRSPPEAHNGQRDNRPQHIPDPRQMDVAYNRSPIENRNANKGAVSESKQQLPDSRQDVYNRSPLQQSNSQRRLATDLRDTSNMNPRSRESPSSGSPVNNGLVSAEIRRDTPSPVLQRQASSSDFPREREKRATKVSSSTTHGAARVSPDSQTDGPSRPIQDESEQKVNQSSVEDEESNFDFKKQYVKVTSRDQKKAYKADFNAYYDEYKSLYYVIQRVAGRFSLYQDELDRTDESNPRYNFLKQRIADEYYVSHPDELRAKSRYKYLYDKLSHIKNLVEEYTDRQAPIHYKSDSSDE